MLDCLPMFPELIHIFLILLVLVVEELVLPPPHGGVHDRLLHGDGDCDHGANHHPLLGHYNLDLGEAQLIFGVPRRHLLEDIPTI